MKVGQMKNVPGAGQVAEVMVDGKIQVHDNLFFLARLPLPAYYSIVKKFKEVYKTIAKFTQTCSKIYSLYKLAAVYIYIPVG